MVATIDAPIECDMFSATEECSTAEIHRIMSLGYGKNFMIDGSVREWFRKFTEGGKNACPLLLYIWLNMLMSLSVTNGGL